MTADPIRSLTCMWCGAQWIVGQPDTCSCVTPNPAHWIDDPTISGALLRLGYAARAAADAFRRLFADLGKTDDR